MGRIRHRNLSKYVQGSANNYGTAPTVGRNSFALRLFSIRVVPSKTDARASAAVVAILAWVLKKVLLTSNGVAYDSFGSSVALDGDRALVGASGRDGYKGAAYIFDLSGGSWSEPKEISLGPDGSANDYFGTSVALDGDRALVGASGRDGPGDKTNQGAAYIFDLSGGNWTKTADISLGTHGVAYDSFGTSVALDGDRALVGASGRDNQGAAYIFDLTGGSWGETADISLGTDGGVGDDFGNSVALDGNRALVGAHERKSDQGAAYIFDTTDGTTWSQPKEITLGTAGGGNAAFGKSVALDGNRALVGASDHDGPGVKAQGAAYIYDYERTN